MMNKIMEAFKEAFAKFKNEVGADAWLGWFNIFTEGWRAAKADSRWQHYEWMRHGQPHIWVNGPDGLGYHCPICGISKCDDYGGFRTCESWILELANRIRGQSPKNAYLEGEARLWIEYLKKRS
jgi:hypothetical protein